MNANYVSLIMDHAIEVHLLITIASVGMFYAAIKLGELLIDATASLRKALSYNEQAFSGKTVTTHLAGAR